MSETPGKEWSEEVRVKEELDIGPTVIQPPSTSYTAPTKEECEDIDYSVPFTNTIKLEDYSATDYESATSPSEFLLGACAPGKIPSDNTYWGDGAGARGSEEVNSLFVHEVRLTPGVQARAPASPESRSDTPTEPEKRHAAAARGGCSQPASAHTTAEELACGVYCARFEPLGNELVDTDQKPFECDLKVHKQTDTSERAFGCEECNASFTSASNLKAHIRTHTGERPFECEICHAKFTVTSNLIVHKRTHTGERPFECGICNVKFTTASNLKRHKLTNCIGDGPFECEICNAKFTYAVTWKRHKRDHLTRKF